MVRIGTLKTAGRKVVFTFRLHTSQSAKAIDPAFMTEKRSEAKYVRNEKQNERIAMWSEFRSMRDLLCYFDE